MNKRVVVLGGGFGGLATAQRLDHVFRHDDDIDILLISDTNFLVYTPMLADVAGGTIEPRFSVPPLRAFLRKKARFQEADVEGIDVSDQKVKLTYSKGNWDEWSSELSYDYLVIALGAITSWSHATGVGTYAVGLKDLVDAIFLRNRVLTMLERAETTQDPKKRRELLTFVVAGGGFSAVEGIAALEDLAHGALRYYPAIRRGELKFILAPHGNRLLEQIDQRLGEYVVKKFSTRDIDVRLGVGVSDVTDRTATLTTGEIIPTRTVVWTAGIEVNPLLQGVDLPKDRHGALQVNNRLQVAGHPNIFALGDCAAVPVPDGQGFYAPTAQNAIREGPVAADNIAALLHNSGNLKAFDYRPIGSLASLGQRQAVAQIGRLQLSGLPAWFAWRGIYLAKLPTVADRVLVALNWITDLVAPVDIVQIPLGRQRRVVAAKMPATPAARAKPVTGQPETTQPSTGERVHS
ncbi:MAG: NAD(P)/FAD-dependent oxidoreductase [Ktedonobacterales bacterium]